MSIEYLILSIIQIETMKSKTTQFLLVFIPFLLAHLHTQAQVFSFEAAELAKLSIRAGMPYLQDSTEFETLYRYLNNMEQESVSNSERSQSDDDCNSINPVLKSFENTKGYNSLRSVQLAQECSELSNGISPEKMSPPIIGDPVLASFFNSKGQLWIGETIFYIKASDRIFVISNNDLKAIESIDNYSYQENPNVVFFGGDVGKADFEYYTQENGSVNFLFNGVLQSGQEVFWELGDGNTASGQSVNHNYSGSSEYTVCVSILSEENGEMITIDKACKTISFETDTQNCIFFIKKDQQEDGKVCFKLNGLGGKYAVSANWNFGDGSTSDELAPCHDYYCNKSYLLSVNGTANTGCTFNRSRIVRVTTFDCCDALASKSETVLFGEYMIKVHLYQLPLPIIGRTIVSTRHYKRRNNKYRRSKALIKNTINGNIYMSDEQNCKCEHPLYMNQVEQKYKSWLITNYKVGHFFQAKREDLWYGKVYINGSLRYTGAVDTSCN